MLNRALIAKELAEILKVCAHPDRIRLVQELRNVELDVNGLATALDLPSSRVSQHLSLLRLHRIVEERREGRHHYYHLVNPQIAGWIVAGLDFVAGRLTGISRTDIRSARQKWSSS